MPRTSVCLGQRVCLKMPASADESFGKVEEWCVQGRDGGSGRAPAGGRAWPSHAATPPASAARPFEALLPRVGAAAPGTYVVSKTALVAAAEEARIPVLLQADVLKGPEGAARVGIVLGADVTQAADVRLRVLTANTGKDGARVAADAGARGSIPGPLRLVREIGLSPATTTSGGRWWDHTRPGGDLIVAIDQSRLSVPDIQAGSLAVTPVVAGEAATTARPANVPFVFGKTTLTPAVSPRFRQDRTISVAFRIYNWTAKAREARPDRRVPVLRAGHQGLALLQQGQPQQPRRTRSARPSMRPRAPWPRA